MPKIFAALLTLVNSVMTMQLSPMPHLTLWVCSKLPYTQEATTIKGKYIADLVEQSVRVIEDGSDSDGDGMVSQLALHSVMLRERDLAAKEGRQPDCHKRAIVDDFLDLTVAAYDSLATTVAWGVKFLADHPAVQGRLQTNIRAALPKPTGRTPTYQERTRAKVPYIDAMVEDVLPRGTTVTFLVCRALCDTMVLGRRSPKGTDVFVMSNGPGFIEPNLVAPNEQRSPRVRRRRG